MGNIIRNVRDLDSSDLHALEHVLGQSLAKDEQLVISVVSPPTEEVVSDETDAPMLPEWCRVYEGLSDDEVAEIERIILQRADLTRSTD